MLTDRRAQALAMGMGEADRWSPWRATDGWQLNGEAIETLRFRDPERELTVGIRYRRDGGYALTLPGGTVEARAARSEPTILAAVIDGRVLTARVVRDGDTIHVFGPSGRASVTLIDPYYSGVSMTQAGGRLTAPMPGLVVSVSVAPGQTVTRGARLMVIEAMKMEHAITAPSDGTVISVRFGPGDKVGEGDEVIVFEPTLAKAS
jgi:3-methylcrotonyl-CoA carboxylase alpha subunit